MQIGHRTPLSVVEEFGLIDALHPGRLDLGIGRSIGRPAPGPDDQKDERELVPAAAHYASRAAGGAHTSVEHADNGLLIPKRFDFRALAGSPKLALTLSLLQQPNAYTPPYSEQIGDVLALLRGTYRSKEDLEAQRIRAKVSLLRYGFWAHREVRVQRLPGHVACASPPRTITAPAPSSTRSRHTAGRSVRPSSSLGPTCPCRQMSSSGPTTNQRHASRRGTACGCAVSVRAWERFRFPHLRLPRRTNGAKRIVLS